VKLLKLQTRRPASADFHSPDPWFEIVVCPLFTFAVLEGSLLVGSVGAIAEKRLARVRQRLAQWIVGAD
jgi:hypothetical protein